MRRESNTLRGDNPIPQQRSSRGLPPLPILGENLTKRTGLLFFGQRNQPKQPRSLLFSQPLSQYQKIDALIAHVLRREIEPLEKLLQSPEPIPLKKIPLSDTQASYLETLDRLYSIDLKEKNPQRRVSETPIFLALVLLHIAYTLSVKPEQPSDVVIALLTDQEKLRQYTKAAKLNHPNKEEIEAFARSLKNGDLPDKSVQDVLALAFNLESSETSPAPFEKPMRPRSPTP